MDNMLNSLLRSIVTFLNYSTIVINLFVLILYIVLLLQSYSKVVG